MKPDRLPSEELAKKLAEKFEKIRDKIKDIANREKKDGTTTTNTTRRLITESVVMNPDDSGIDIVAEGNKSGIDTSGIFIVLGEALFSLFLFCW